eukprot:GHVN01078556.1.p1 GENE.GHVN01078556.1~~GHVN01078556.1.p1  ORF type:complete len:529 (+),score=13.30 GHVN01078556.1:162-1589(+)
MLNHQQHSNKRVRFNDPNQKAASPRGVSRKVGSKKSRNLAGRGIGGDAGRRSNTSRGKSSARGGRVGIPLEATAEAGIDVPLECLQPSRQLIALTLLELLDLVRSVVQQAGSDGFLTQHPEIQWTRIAKVLKKPAKTCEYVFWNFERKHFRKSLGLVLIQWDPSMPIKTVDPMDQLEFKQFELCCKRRLSVLVDCIQAASSDPSGQHSDGNQMEQPHQGARDSLAKSSRSPSPPADPRTANQSHCYREIERPRGRAPHNVGGPSVSTAERSPSSSQVTYQSRWGSVDGGRAPRPGSQHVTTPQPCRSTTVTNQLNLTGYPTQLCSPNLLRPYNASSIIPGHTLDSSLSATAQAAAVLPSSVGYETNGYNTNGRLGMHFQGSSGYILPSEYRHYSLPSHHYPSARPFQARLSLSSQPGFQPGLLGSQVPPRSNEFRSSHSIPPLAQWARLRQQQVAAQGRGFLGSSESSPPTNSQS